MKSYSHVSTITITTTATSGPSPPQNLRPSPNPIFIKWERKSTIILEWLCVLKVCHLGLDREQLSFNVLALIKIL